ncbi:hypothetical protein Pfo_016623 [Paulownia fortunei]|nr:hypothetical protein Pfo_016623 [Paulownia fortunei]
MNFDVGGPSHVSSSTSSSSTDSDTNAQIMLELQAIDVEQETLFCMSSNTSLILAHYLIQQNNQHIHGGSIPGHIVINREQKKADRNLFNNYFAENPCYNEAMFRRRYRMSRNLFLRIVRQWKVVTVLAYGIAADATDEYIKIEESTVIERLKRFCRAIVEVFADRYLRAPNANDVSRLLHGGKQRGFPGIGIAPPAHYVIQEKEYDMGYYLADSIYPKWSTIIQTIHDPREGYKKDVERAFGVLQSQFAIVAGSVHFWKKYILHDIITTCIIMHNMIIEDERDVDAPIQDWMEAPTPKVEMVIDEHDRFQKFLPQHRQIKNKDAHFIFRDALIVHLWDEYTNFEN